MKSDSVAVGDGLSCPGHPPSFDAAVGVLAAGVAHDFNNAITALRALLYLVGVETGPLASLAQCESIVDRCSDLSRWLFSATSNAARYSTADCGPVDLNTCVRDAVALASGALPSSVRIDLALANEPIVVRSAPGLIAYVIVHLVQNATDALPGGGTISTRVVGRRGEHLGVIVEDAGLGMAPETLRRAFEPFFTTKAPKEGLGLSNVRRIVQALGGTVTLTSTLGQGTIVRVSLPSASPPPG